MENGFTEHNSKGLFTFYREQHELDRPAKGQGAPNNYERRSNVNYSSLPSHEYKKQKERAMLSTNDGKHIVPQSQRYTFIQEQGRAKVTSAPKSVVSLNFNLTSSRKNEFYFQLLGSQNRKRQLEIDLCLKKQNSPRLDFRKLVSGLSVREMPASEVRELFKPKKDYFSNIHTVKKAPYKINSVIARCVQQGIKQREKTTSPVDQSEEEKRFHMPLLRRQEQGGKKNQKANRVFKDALQLRRHKLQNASFWEQLKERKARREASARDVTARMKEWTASIYGYEHPSTLAGKG